MRAKHTQGPLTAMLKPPASYSDHGWRAMAMCGTQWMLGAPASAAIKVEDGLVVAGWNNEENARRLAACWNACIDVPTELLEDCPAPFSGLRQERDELLNALRDLEGLAERYRPSGHPIPDAQKKARAAIAAATGSASHG